MEDKRVKELLKKYNAGSCTPEEKAWVESWYLNQISAEDDDSLEKPDYQAIKNKIWNNIQRERPVRKVVRWPRIAAAAIVILAATLAIYTYNSRSGLKTQDADIAGNTIQPGGNKAILTLANGKKISLTDAANGQLAEQAGVKITKAADGQLVYTVTKTAPSSANWRSGAEAFNTIETPRGGQYRVILPDGTKVWLNAVSSLTYPAAFTGNERRVTLTGEGYFEVAKKVEGGKAKGKRVPFIVTTKEQEVEVLGTHFNINAYTDEEAIRTTLLEGSVKVSNLTSHSSHLLRPGQQARLDKESGIRVVNVNAEDAVAWKNGYFLFKREHIQTVMRQLSRWYDFEVAYQGTVSNDEFVGKIPRNATIEQVIRVLKLSNVNCRAEGKKLIIIH